MYIMKYKTTRKTKTTKILSTKPKKEIKTFNESKRWPKRQGTKTEGTNWAQWQGSRIRPKNIKL